MHEKHKVRGFEIQMGDYFQVIVDKQVSLDEASALASSIREWLINEGVIESTTKDCVLSESGVGYPPGTKYETVVDFDGSDIHHLWTNGLNIIVGRMVYHSGQGLCEVKCPKCGCKIPEKEWYEAVTQWYEGAAAELECSACHFIGSVTLCWFDPPWGFGNLGFEFWNWHPFRKSFLKEFTKRTGHETVLVYGKL